MTELSGGGATESLRTLAIDELLSRTDGTEAVHAVADALGSSVALTDPLGAVATEYTYAPFGATETSGTANANPFRFTGREDDGTGLYYYRGAVLRSGQEPVCERGSDRVGDR